MTMDQKIDELLELARENSALLGEHGAQLQQHTEQFKEQGTRLDGLVNLFLEERKQNNQKIDDLLKIVGEQGDRHELRFTQIDARFDEMDARFVGIDGKIDKVYESLSQDIQVFAEDLHHMKRRVGRLEKKLLS